MPVTLGVHLGGRYQRGVRYPMPAGNLFLPLLSISTVPCNLLLSSRKLFALLLSLLLRHKHLVYDNTFCGIFIDFPVATL